MGVSKIGVPQNGWFIRENPIKMDDLGGTPIFGNTLLYTNLRSVVDTVFFSNVSTSTAHSLIGPALGLAWLAFGLLFVFFGGGHDI